MVVFDIRGKYVLSFLLLVVITILATNTYLEYALGEWMESQLVTELRRHAETGRSLVEAQEQALTPTVLNPLAHQLGQHPDLRITLIAADGQVLGDSQRDDEEVRAMANQGQQPEFLAAIQEGFGQSKHYFDTSSRPMLYVAVPFRHALSGSGVVRVATAMESVRFVNNRLHWIILTAGLIAGLAAVTLSSLSAHWTTRSQRHLIAGAEQMARSRHAPRIEVAANDELAGLAGFLNRLVEEKNLTWTQLSEQKSQMTAVLHSMNEGVLALDGQQHITLMNRSAQHLLGLPQPVPGQPLATLLPANVLAGLGLDRNLSSTQPGHAEFDLGGPPPRRVMATVTFLHEHQGHVVVLRDVTEKHRLDTIRRDFVANVSHELRTPVSVLQANAQTLLDGALEDPQYSRLLLEAMERNANRLAQIIADLLDLSRLEADQVIVDRQAIPLLAVVQEVVELVQGTADTKQIALQIEMPPALMVYADAEVLRRILINFLDNAIKYIPDHSRITVRTRTVQEQRRLEVVDNGPGIAPQHRERLFERFYRVDSGRSRKMGGTGLGLSIVKHLADKMGERVGMEAVEPQGSLFWVTLSPPST
ncbi:MAG: ATP-binding protein [Magnetococcus sp. DMHC-8]